MSKFIQPVSMVVTKEQYKRDLKQHLLEMGYKEVREWNEYDIYPIITNNEGDRLGKLGRVKEDRAEHYNRYFIDHYNPKLFLAIAAMTNEKFGIKGEWWKCVFEDAENFNFGELYISIKPLNELNALIDKHRVENGYYFNNIEKFTKATLQELINEFSIQKSNCTTDTISIPSDSIKSLDNLLDMHKDSLNNKLIDAIKGLLSLAHNYYNDDDISRGNICMNSISRLIKELELE